MVLTYNTFSQARQAPRSHFLLQSSPMILLLQNILPTCRHSDGYIEAPTLPGGEDQKREDELEELEMNIQSDDPISDEIEMKEIGDLVESVITEKDIGKCDNSAVVGKLQNALDKC